MEKEDKLKKNVFLTKKKDISFNEDDKENMIYPHHDGLVIPLYVANQFV